MKRNNIVHVKAVLVLHLCSVTNYSFLKSRIAAALVESDATEELKEEATARYLASQDAQEVMYVSQSVSDRSPT